MIFEEVDYLLVRSISVKALSSVESLLLRGCNWDAKQLASWAIAIGGGKIKLAGRKAGEGGP